MRKPKGDGVRYMNRVENDRVFFSWRDLPNTLMM